MVKFRVWDKGNSCWATDFTISLYGELLCDNGTTGFIKDNFTLLQWTGLFDKTEKPIFEGDIVFNIASWGAESVVIERDPDTHQLICKDLTVDDRENLDYHDLENWRIGGNIYENPELLGGDDDESDT